MSIYDRDYMRGEQEPDSPLGDARDFFRQHSKSILGVVLGLILVGGGLAFIEWWRTPTAERPVDVNTASRGQLCRIPLVKPALADSIVAARPYASVDDVRRAYGVGPRTLERIRPYLYVRTNLEPAEPPQKAR